MYKHNGQKTFIYSVHISLKSHLKSSNCVAMGNIGTAAALKLNNFVFNKYENNNNNRSLLSTVAVIFTISNEHVSSA